MIYRYASIVLPALILMGCSQPAGQQLQAGPFTVWISNEPEPLEVGERALFTMVVEDGQGGAVEDCQARFRQTMPGMEMSTDDVYVVLAPQGKGRYQGMSHEFHMGGDWVLAFELTCGSGDPQVLSLERHLEWPE